MPDLDWNRKTWDGSYDWVNEGEEWSSPWGGSEAQWFGAIFPRLHRMLPARSILEIAPGFGRWTKFLLPHCGEYIGVDISLKCVETLRRKFKSSGAKFICNDGVSLSEVPNKRCDFVFSFDSLVHAEIEVLENYIPQILEKMSATGICFLHHSNLQDCNPPPGVPVHFRGKTVSARNVRSLIEKAGGRVLLQELVNWNQHVLLDCFTTFSAGRSSAEPVIIRNMKFMIEADVIRSSHGPYVELRGGAAARSK